MAGSEDIHLNRVAPDMSVLDVVSKHRMTESIFKKYDEIAGECICCQSLFETIEAVAEKYRLNLDELINDLEDAIAAEQ